MPQKPSDPPADADQEEPETPAAEVLEGDAVELDDTDEIEIEIGVVVEVDDDDEDDDEDEETVAVAAPAVSDAWEAARCARGTPSAVRCGRARDPDVEHAAAYGHVDRRLPGRIHRN